MPVVQTLDARYIEGAALVTLLKKLFGPGKFVIDVCKGWVHAIPFCGCGKRILRPITWLTLSVVCSMSMMRTGSRFPWNLRGCVSIKDARSRIVILCADTRWVSQEQERSIQKDVWWGNVWAASLKDWNGTGWTREPRDTSGGMNKENRSLLEEIRCHGFWAVCHFHFVDFHNPDPNLILKHARVNPIDNLSLKVELLF